MGNPSIGFIYKGERMSYTIETQMNPIKRESGPEFNSLPPG